MAGRVQWEAQVDSNVAKLLSETKELRNELETINKKDIKLDIDSKSLNSIVDLFGKMESHLKDLKKVFVDVGDGAEFSPLLKTINNIQSSIKELSASVKNIGFNMNIDFGSDTEMEAKIQSKISNALQAYQRLFDHIKMSSVGGAIINTKFFDFDINQYDTMMGKLQAYKKFIDNMRKEAKSFFGGQDVLYQDTEKSYWTAASSAMGQVTKAFNEMNVSTDTSPLENLFGKTDLTEVVAQLNLIVDKLGEISTIASEFKNAFANGFNVSASVEEIEKLTSRVKELEDELSKVKVSPTSPVETNISSSIKDTFQGETEASEMGKVATAVNETVQAKKDFATANEGVQTSVDGSKSKLELETELMEHLAKSAREAADAKKEFVDANKQVQGSVDDTGKSVKKDKYKNKSKISEDEYTGKSDYYASIANQKLKNSGNTILGETVSTELVDGLVKVTAKIKTADDTWKTFSAKIDADGNMFEQRFRTITKGVDKLETELKNFGLDTNPALTYGETLKKAEEIRSSLKLDDSYTIKVDSNELVTITQKLSDVKSSTTSVTQTFKSAQDAIEHFGKEASSSAEKTTVALKGVKASAESTGEAVGKSASHLDKISDMVTNYRKSLKDLSAVPDADHRFASFESLLNDLNIAITELENHQTILKNKDFVSEDDIVKTNELSNNITTLIETIKKIPKSERGFTDLGVSKMAEKIHSILEENPRLSRKAKEEIRAYYKELTTGNPTKPLNEIYDAVNRIIQKEREAGRAGKGFLDIFNNKLLYEGAAKLAGYFLSFTDFIRYARDGFETIKEYDKALTEMNKVSNETINALKEFQQESFKTAESIGTTAIAIQNSTAGWMKLGYSLKDSAKLSEWSNIYANVGDMGIEEATEHMVSSVKAWSSEFANDIEASEAIVDRYNHIGNSYAITSAEIGEAMEISAAALKAGGNSLNESLGLIVSGNLIQQDASTTSSALKILSLRIRGAKAELEEMQESTEGLADSSSKMREEIQALTGVDIMLDEDTFKSTAQIIKEIGAVWDSMSDVSQAATLEKISGKNRASTVAGLIENYEIIDDVIKSAEEAQGSALKENQRYVESIEGSLNRLSSAWDKLWVNENNREVITFFIDLAKSILGVIDNIGLLNTAIIGISLFKGIKNVGEGKNVSFHCFE